MKSKQKLVVKKERKQREKTGPRPLTQKAIKIIKQIQKTRGLTTEAVLEEARNRKSPLHHLFEWDDSKAAEQWRLQQARMIINQVKVIIGEKEYSQYESVVVHVIDDVGQIQRQRVYKPIEEIMGSKELREQMIANSLRQLRYWEEENQKYQELRPIMNTAQIVRRRLNKIWDKKAKKKR